MHFKAFHAEFEKISKRETRSLTILEGQKIPEGEYVFLPLYCMDKKCDCRRTLINVLQASPKYGPFHAATISYGWEPLSFYREWSFGMNEADVEMLKGPALDPFNPQSPTAPDLLKSFVHIVLDDIYAERIQRQYAMFKYKIGMKLPPDLAKLANPSGECRCGSGRPFKLCCGRGKFSRRYRR